MICYVYRSPRKRDTYLYIRDKDDFQCVPEQVMKIFGTPDFSFSFDLHADRKLAQVEATDVMAGLDNDGFYLQLPRTDFDLEQIEQDIVDSLDRS